MILDGTHVAKTITDNIEKVINDKGYSPKLSVILIGEDFASEKYVNYKVKKAEQIGIDIEVFRFN